MRLIEVSRFLIRRFEPNFERGENRKIYSKLKWMYELFCENLLANKYANQYGFFFLFPPKTKNGEEGGKVKKKKKNENPRSADVFAICQEFIPIFVLKETHGEKIKVFIERERGGGRERDCEYIYGS